MIVTKHFNIYFFEEFGIGIKYIPKWMIQIQLIFITINYILEEAEKYVESDGEE